MLRSAALLVALLAGPVAAQAPDRVARLACLTRIRSEAEQLRAACGAPRILLAVAARGPGADWQWSADIGGRDGASRRSALDAAASAGSVTKVATAFAVLQLAAQGRLDLDAAVARYLPADLGAWAEQVTVRQLLQHRSGLPREAARGHWFEPGEVTLPQAVASLAGASLRSAPGREFGYSNAGYAVLGLVVERVTAQPFATAVRELVLQPLGMTRAAIVPERGSDGVLAPGMRTAWGETWAVRPFPVAAAPAGGLQAPIADLARLAAGWLPGEPQARVPPMLRTALATDPDATTEGYGLGVEFDAALGTMRLRHPGTAPGCSTEIQALPEHGLAVACVVPLDFANGLAAGLATRVLQQLLALQDGRSLPALAAPQPVGRAKAAALAGRYAADGEWFDLFVRGEDLVFDPCLGIATVQRRIGERFVSEDPASLGERILRTLPNGAVHDGSRGFERRPLQRPAPPREGLRAWLGEYGWDHAQIVVYETEGRLGVVFDGHVRELPEPDGKDAFVCSPGTHGGDRLRFLRDADGAVIALQVGEVRWPRIVHPADGSFRIPLRAPLAELRAAAHGATPPKVTRAIRTPDLVDLRSFVPGLRFDLRYAGDDNFLGERIYAADAVPWLQREAASALRAVVDDLRRHGYGLCVFDAYRPWSITKLFWDATPDSMRQFVADPANGSRHNRGCAIDLTLFDLATGQLAPMPCGFDEFTARAYPEWPGGTEEQRWHRDLLRAAMERQGFTVFEYEWWHFDFGAWREYPLQDSPLR